MKPRPPECGHRRRMEIARTSKFVVVAALVAVAFAVRLYGLAAPGLSEDEVNKMLAA